MRATAFRVPAALLAIVLFAGACSDTVSDEAAADVLARCEDVPQATLDLIETGLTIGDGTLSNAAAVETAYEAPIWVIGAQVNGEGFEGDQYIGIWVVAEGIEVDGITDVAAADDFTSGISTWGEDLWFEASGLLDGVSAAGACVIAQQKG
ncbi:MAG: hypothetical protein ABFS21_00020 [Actinomycetota bacterium]